MRVVHHGGKILRILLAILLIIIGVAGLILPILNGIIFLLLGFIILSFDNYFIEQQLFKITQKNKTVHRLYLKLEKHLRRFFGK